MRYASLLVFALVGPLSAQGELDLRPCARGIGGRIDYSIGGGTAFRPFLFFTSLQRGSFPLSAVDPRDSRSLGIGFDLLGLLLLGKFDGRGQAAFPLVLPNDASLAGKALLHQAIAFPGTTTFFGALSQVAVVPLELRGAWRTYPQFPMTDKRAWISMIPLRDGRLLAVGGGNGALLALAAVRSTERYDPATRRFTRGPDLTQPRGIHVTHRLPDGRWLLAGGVNQLNDPQKTCEFYDPKTDRFSPAPSMRTPRMLHTGTTLADGRILVAGGMTNLNGNTLQQIQSTTASTEIYDPRTRTWSQGPAMTEARAGHSATRLADGRVVLIGGITLRTIFKLPDFSSSADVFDPRTGKLTRLAGSLRAKRGGHSVTVLKSGKILVAGGLGGSILPNGGTALKSCELYDLRTGTWSPAAPLAAARALMTAVRLHDGRFVVSGGVAGTLLSPGAVRDVESYDPATAKWSRLPSLAAARATHLALELRSCVLFVLGGGSGKTGSALATQELLYR